MLRMYLLEAELDWGRLLLAGCLAMRSLLLGRAIWI